MRPPFPLKDIALQSGLSLATVDRALHGRGHVAKATGLRIEAAIAELERQYADARIGGRRLIIDVVMETPQRFSNAVRAAFDAELPGMRPASLSARFHVAETMEERDLLAILKRIRRRGSHGVVVKVPSTPAIAEMAAELMDSGIPVVTLVTDLPATVRQGYVGMDNRVGGQRPPICWPAWRGRLRARCWSHYRAPVFPARKNASAAFAMRLKRTRRILGS